MLKRRIIVGSVILVLAIAAAGVGFFLRNSPRETTAQTADQYVPMVVGRGTLSTEISGTGNVTSGSVVDVHASKSGVVDRVLVAVGDEVRPGDVLIELSKAEIDVQQAEATVRQRRESLQSAEESLDKVKKLCEKGAATAAELRNAESNVATAQENLESAMLKLSQLLTSEEESQISSPIAGVVSEVRATVGSTVGVSSPIVSIVDLSKLVLEVTVDEYDIGKVKAGQKADISIDALKDRSFSGTVTHVGKLGETKSGVVLFPVRIAVDNPTPDLRPGMSAEAEVIVERAENVLIVPNDALEVRMGRYAARVFDEAGEAKYRMVTVGLRTSQGTEIVSGLSEGDRVAVPNTQAQAAASTQTRSGDMGSPIVGGMPGIGAGTFRVNVRR